MLSRSIRRHAPRRALLAAAISLAFVFAAEAAPNAHDFDVAAGPLVDVVRALGAASGAAIEVDARDAEAMATVNGVHGEYDVDTALAAALIYKLEPEAAKIPGSTVFRKQLIDQATAYLDKLSQSLRGEPGDDSRLRIGQDIDTV